MTSKKLQAAIAVAVGLGTFSTLQLIQAAVDISAVPVGHIVLHATLLGLLTTIAVYFGLRQLEIEAELRRAAHFDQVISELNHHIRNALQVINNRTETIRSEQPSEMQEVRQAINRIDWALREILPRGYGRRTGAPRILSQWHRSAPPRWHPPDSKDKTYTGTG